jgi:ribonuclease BN (tRNA processing enzyme)
MRVVVLGASQGVSRAGHFSSLLVDGVLALDAGSIASALTLDDQAAIRHILLTHKHYDHICEIASFGFNRFGRNRIEVCCTSDVREALEDTVLSDRIWINFFARPTPETSTFTHVPVQSGRAFRVGKYDVLPFDVPHSLHTLAYAVTADAVTLLYTGDNGPGAGSAWAAARPHFIITEVTSPNAQSKQAAEYGHLTPNLIRLELVKFRALCGYLPRLAAIHVNPFHRQTIIDELKMISDDLSADISVPEEGSEIMVTATR